LVQLYSNPLLDSSALLHEVTDIGKKPELVMIGRLELLLSMVKAFQVPAKWGDWKIIISATLLPSLTHPS
jgi:hypothetical protein